MYAVGDAYKAHTECIQAYKRVKERNSSSTSSLYCLFLHLPLPVFQAIVFYCPRLQACTDTIGPSESSIKSHCPFIRIRVAATFDGHGGLPSHATCMHCMHQKAPYARYANTQLRKRLHTMHTETRIGVSVGLRARKCMQLGMHTKCIQVSTST